MAVIGGVKGRSRAGAPPRAEQALLEEEKPSLTPAPRPGYEAETTRERVATEGSCGSNSVVECHLAKVDVEGSNPFSRSIVS